MIHPHKAKHILLTDKELAMYNELYEYWRDLYGEAQANECVDTHVFCAGLATLHKSAK